MSTLSSKPAKTYRPIELISIFVFLALILMLLMTPFTGNLYDVLRIGGKSDASSSVYSFSADQQYWSVNCSHGWSSDSTCDNIAARAQSCSINTDSAYCSEYENYLKQFSN